MRGCCSSIGTATLVGYGLLNYRWVFSAGRFLQNAIASGTSNPQPGGPVIRTFQLPPPGVPNAWNDTSEPQQPKVELWARKWPRILLKVATSTSLLGSFTCRKFTTWDRRLYFHQWRVKPQFKYPTLNMLSQYLSIWHTNQEVRWKGSRTALHLKSHHSLQHIQLNYYSFMYSKYDMYTFLTYITLQL